MSEEDEEAAMLAAVIKVSLEQAANNAKAQAGDPRVAPTVGLLGMVREAAAAAAAAAEAAAGCGGAGEGLPAGGSLGHVVQPAGLAPLRQVSVGSDAAFFYYGCCGEADRGWGCAYRCAQTIISSVSAEQSVPSINDIQVALSLLPDGVTAFGPDKIGSTSWIEPPDVAAYLQASHSIDSVESAVTVSDAEGLEGLCSTLWGHFTGLHAQLAEGPASWVAPVMVDDSMFAYTIAGVASTAAVSTAPSDLEGRAVEHTACLVFDPHVADPTAAGAAPTGLTLEAFAASGEGARFTSTAPLPGADLIVRWVSFKDLFVEGARGDTWMVCRPTRLTTPRE